MKSSIIIYVFLALTNILAQLPHTFTLTAQVDIGRFAQDVAVDSNGTIFFANSDIGGLFAYTYSGITEVEDKFSDIPQNYILRQNYPNPFNPSTNIEFQIPNSQYVSLKIFNLLGQEIETLVSQKLATGNYTYNWDASSFASGIYFYKLQIGNDFSDFKKMILIR